MNKQMSFFQRLVTIILAIVVSISSSSIKANAAEKNGIAILPSSNISVPNDATHVLGRAEQKQTVYNSPGAGAIGSIFARESFTILNYNISGYMYIEYSSPNGTKKGYISKTGNVIYSGTVLATVKQTATVYYGNESRFQSAGTVYAGENVVALERKDGWCYIEYNTTNGRKCAYILEQYLNLTVRDCNELRVTPFKTPYISGKYTVYAGPTDQYCTVGYVENEYVDVKQEFIAYGKTVLRINYRAGSSWKSGYIFI